MELVLEIAGDQIDGARDYQEDAFLVSFLDDSEAGSRSSALVIMADGMGGHAAGNIASNLVVSTFNKTFTGGFGRLDPPILLRQALDKSNDALAESIRETPGLDGMGCTMVAGLISRGKAYWISVGDSHFYLVRDGQLVKRNEDHSYGGYLDRMRAQGMEVDAEPGLSRNMLMSAMTGDPVAEVDCPNKALQLLAGDRIIVSSDGLDTLSEAAILQTCAWANSAKECVSALLKAVEDAKKPRQDNTTVIVVDISGSDSPPPPPRRQPTVPADNEDTQRLSISEIQDAMALPAAAPATPARPVVPPAPRPPARSIGKRLALVAALLVAGGVAAYFYLMPLLEPKLGPQRDPAVGGNRDGETAQNASQLEDPPQGSSGSGEANEQPSADPQQPADGGDASTAGTLPASGGPGSDGTQTATQTAVDPLLAGVGESFRDPLKSGGEGPEMLSLPAGTYAMGATGFSSAQSELPSHEVNVPGFAISRHELTVAEYSVFAKANRRSTVRNRIAGERAPVVGVSWNDALAYTRWLSEQTGQRYRLPSEAEWEYAARGGLAAPYPWGFEPGSGKAHCFDCESGYDLRAPTAVGRFAANGFGLHDTAGNVKEWVHDCYHNNYAGAPSDGSVWEGGDCSTRVVRGGSFSTTSGSIRSGARAKWPQNKGADDIGFRVVRELE